MTEQTEHDVTVDEIKTQLKALEERLTDLEQKDQTRARSVLLSVFAIYAIFASLLILHWAGHFMRHN